MNLAWQISIIDDLIRENQEATIKDYLLTLQDIQQVENAINEQIMPKPPVTEEQKEEILQMAATMTVNQIRKGLGLDTSTVYRALKASGYNSQEQKDIRKEERWRAQEIDKIRVEQAKIDQRLAEIKEQENRRAARRAVPVVSPKLKPKAQPETVTESAPIVFSRPRAEYSNSGFIATSQKYAS